MKIRKFDLPLRIATLLVLAGLVACNSTSPTSTPKPAVTSTLVPPATVQALDALRTVTVGDLKRTYLLHIPPGLNNRQAVPLVFVFHGFTGNANEFRSATGFDAISNANGFIAVYPNGTGASNALSWNAGSCCGYADQNGINEPAFVRAILADVETLASVDNKRIYATGHSNGGFLAYALACEMSDTFAAVAPVAGLLLYYPCQPKQPVSLMHIHGLADTVVPFQQSRLDYTTGQAFSPVKDSVTAWAKLDKCADAGPAEKNGILSHTPYTACPPGIAVELDTLDGVEHVWPSPFIPVSQMIWDFFAAHPKP